MYFLTIFTFSLFVSISNNLNATSNPVEGPVEKVEGNNLLYIWGDQKLSAKNLFQFFL